MDMAKEHTAINRYHGDRGIVQLKMDIDQIACLLKRRKVVSSSSWSNQDAASHAGAAAFRMVLRTKEKQEAVMVVSLLGPERSSPSKAVAERRFLHRVVVNRDSQFSDVRKIVEGIVMPYYRGFKAEELAEEVLRSQAGSKGLRMVQSFRRGTAQEDKNGIDFAMDCLWRGKSFSFVFDLKSGRKGQEDAMRKPGHTPTILAGVDFLRNRPGKFVKKVERLAFLTFQKKVLGKDIPYYAFHV